MALTHADNIRNDVCDLIVDAIDVGTLNPTGKLQLLSSIDSVVAELLFGNPAFKPAGEAVPGRSGANTVTGDADAAGGVAVKFVVLNRDEDLVFTGTFGTTGADMLGTAGTIAVDDVVEIEDDTLFYEAMP